MGFLLSFTLVVLSFASLSALQIQTQEIKSARLLDLVIRDYTFRSYNKYVKTGELHQIKLPANLSGITVDTVRFRCGSLQKYGAKIKEFHLGIGVTVHPCIERVLIVRQYLGSNWSSIYYDNYELSGYRLISPVLGLLAYNIGDSIKLSTPSELQIQAGKKPITIDFSNTTRLNITSGNIPLCASFDHDGRVTLANQASQNICVATRYGHFGLVVESPLIPSKKTTLSKWKITIGSTIGAALGVFLLSLLLIAMFVNAKKKARMDELERRAYEEEVLQVSMVGHISTHTASSTRTMPRIEHDDEYT
ncbi:unnamed protein product [Fraxinus pennsylvanica]|uniref:Transmembrane protein n=1 Tax=Fraxinus pennsylvanica TaxID=56036 RepID=A0AAD2ECP5_9LAMI|nr:unnamed protein product [Fraxinus pennsylvanica]